MGRWQDLVPIGQPRKGGYSSPPSWGRWQQLVTKKKWSLRSPELLIQGHMMPLAEDCSSLKRFVAMHMGTWQLSPRAFKPHSNNEPLGLEAHLLCKDRASKEMSRSIPRCWMLPSELEHCPQPLSWGGTIQKTKFNQHQPEGGGSAALRPLEE